MSESENAHMSKWWYETETRTESEFKIKCSKCGAKGFVENAAGEVISIACSNKDCDNDFEIHNIF